MSLHNQMMNLPCATKAVGAVFVAGYKLGHRDARHACAEMALPYDRLAERMKAQFGLPESASCAEVLEAFERLIYSVEAGL